MNLPGTSVSVWLDTTEGTKYPQLTSDITVDVAIVGGGITGLTAALLLKRAGLRVAVIEGSQIGSGVTGYTTAHLTEAADERYQDLISSVGDTDAKLVAESSRAAIERIAKFVAEEKIDCDFQRVPGYLYTEKSQDVSEIESEAEAVSKLVIPAALTKDVPLPFPVEAAVMFPNQAQFNPIPYLQGLAKAIDGGGSFIFEQSSVVDITGDKPSRVSTEQGTVTALDVIIATHTPIHNLNSLPDLYVMSTKIAPYRSYVIGVRLRSPLPPGLFWDTEEPYHYTRSYKDLLIIGGEDHKTGEDVDNEACFERLEVYARSLYDVASIDYRWSAQLYEPVDGLPYIGKTAANSNIYVATGYSGNGMTFGTVGGMLTSDLILGRTNPWSDLYDPNRANILASAQRFVTENLGVAKHFVADRLFKSEGNEPSDVAPGEGKILDINGKKYAVYRDETDYLCSLSPVCTHAGCIVDWNNAEKTWDCPCHGGRFSPTGEVLNGPPITDLDQKELPSQFTTKS
ncbi:FAD-dependent oxidoreductase [Coleofasciculus sp. FACHB-542]|uniref:FAD-dependent oxidoreductase n=1 Tax=Coleofasciculus sp. FACHB-542 TaxID=2692787 RepID=UPI00168322F3|nr:FAD-dependent oxidoreductase [Coleofasciculus sp. FACHB-542]MBD2086325.1 FAD-dependent oxidoreductase [Coleofasciculus sp. FACHB-542]